MTTRDPIPAPAAPSAPTPPAPPTGASLPSPPVPIDAIPALVWSTDAAGRLAFLSAAWTAVTGEPPAETLARPDGARRFVHPDDRATLAARWAEHLPGGAAEGTPFSVEVRLRRADGAWRWHLARVAAVRDAAGALTAWVGTATDIDAQKAAQRAAADREALLAGVLASTDAFVYVKGADGRYLVCNEAAAAFLGAPRAQIVGQDWDARALSPADLATIRATDRGVMAGGLPVRLEERLTTPGPDGRPTTRTFISVKSPLRDATGAVAGVVGVSTEITDRVRLADQLARANLQLREQQAEAEATNLQLQEQQAELEITAQHLQEQTTELEAQQLVLQDQALRLEAQAAALRDANARLVAANAQLAEQADELATARERLALATEASALGIFDLDVASGALVWDAETRRVFGVGPDEPVDLDVFYAALHPDDRARLVAVVGAVLEPASARPGEGGVPVAHFDTEYRVVRPEGHREAAPRTAGRVRHVRATGRVWFTTDATGRAVAARRFTGTVRDVTAEREAEAAFAVRDAEFRAMADQIPQLAWMARPDGAIDWYNQRWYDYTGTTLETMQGWGWQAVHHPDHVEGVTRRYAAAVARGERWEDTFPIRGRDGTWRWFLSRANPIRDAAGRIVRWFGTNTDVTEQRDASAERERLLTAAERARDEAEAARRAAERAQAEAERANAAKSEFLANMSHELRTPLNAIQGHVQLMEMELHGPVSDAQREALGRVQRAQQHLLGLITDVLNYAKLESGRVEYRVVPVRAAEVVADVAAMLAPQLTAKGLTCRIVTPDDPLDPRDDADPALTVLADREKLAQVMLNLLGNALKFTPPGGTVTLELLADAPPALVRAADAAPRAALRVRDTGIGIPPDKLEAVFEPFVQVQGGLTRPHEGTGLGLAISRDLARGMGGDLVAESVVGAGSTFSVVLRRVG